MKLSFWDKLSLTIISFFCVLGSFFPIVGILLFVFVLLSGLFFLGASNHLLKVLVQYRDDNVDTEELKIYYRSAIEYQLHFVSFVSNGTRVSWFMLPLIALLFLQPTTATLFCIVATACFLYGTAQYEETTGDFLDEMGMERD